MKLMRVKDIQKLTSLSGTTIWKLEREGISPKGHSLPAVPTTKVWLESDVQEWIQQQIAVLQRSDA
jgi:predicted DNA-binding transcriptional regulator AlpA